LLAVGAAAVDAVQDVVAVAAAAAAAAAVVRAEQGIFSPWSVPHCSPCKATCKRKSVTERHSSANPPRSDCLMGEYICGHGPSATVNKRAGHVPILAVVLRCGPLQLPQSHTML